MHKYFKAAGFPDFITERGVYEFLEREVVKPENLYSELNIDPESTVREFRLMLADNIGLAADLLYVAGRQPLMTGYYPFFETYDVTTMDSCMIERHTATETFSGLIDNVESGITLIFYLSNSMDFRKKLHYGTRPDKSFKGTYLSAFTNEAKVLLPVAVKEMETERDNRMFNRHIFRGPGMQGPNGNGIFGHADLLGDENDLPEGPFADSNEEEDDFFLFPLTGPGEENLGPDGDNPANILENELMMFDQINERIRNEDVYTLVEQTFIPWGVECDQYLIVGEITDCEETVNRFSGEELYIIGVSCNDVKFRVCMRKRDLTGEPEPGRRLKCGIWLQGHVNLES
ncbi:MAG: DUF3881 family protein [Eubacteriales bacterium]|nr:DUF3881 family protein [Eubacteriales bacterium]